MVLSSLCPPLTHTHTRTHTHTHTHTYVQEERQGSAAARLAALGLASSVDFDDSDESEGNCEYVCVGERRRSISNKYAFPLAIPPYTLLPTTLPTSQPPSLLPSHPLSLPPFHYVPFLWPFLPPFLPPSFRPSDEVLLNSASMQESSFPSTPSTSPSHCIPIAPITSKSEHTDGAAGESTQKQVHIPCNHF